MDFLFIMAGGSGERFWPLSRKSKPKQLLRLFSGETLLGETVRRAEKRFARDRIFILTNEAQVGPTREALPAFPPDQIIAEPAKRDTAPAAALATAIARQRDPQAVLALLPADQRVKDADAFGDQLVDAFDRARPGTSLLTIAIPPTYPATGFGYLQMGEAVATGPCGSKIHRVTRFIEKPDLTRAQHYLEEGNYAWNAGIFVWKADAFLEAARQTEPALAGFIDAFPTGDATAHIHRHFPDLPKISLDYAVMEKAPHVEAVRARFDWDDVGSWTSLPNHLLPDANHNTVRGPVVTHDARGNILIADKRVIAACGVEDLIIVETDDAILVCHKSKAQDVKHLLPHLPPEQL